ncbi:MAG: isoleucine--tRNA ligase [Chitinophagaceae bacterium]
MAAKYKEFSQLNLPLIEQQILAKWEASDTFNKSESIRQGSKPFIFYEGPPSANGLPGIHHVIGRTLKDLVCRYKTMQNFQVKRKGGWDTHGLPVELGVEKLLGITKEDIGHKISVADYNTKCREEVLRFKDRWEELTLKMGYWVNLDNPYITFTNEYIETLWWCLKTLHGKKLLYKSVSIQPYSPAAGTGLSSHELNQPGTYRDVKDTSVVAMFRLIRNNQSDFLFEAVQQESSPDQRDPAEEHPVDATGKADLFFLAWTTTPWTLPSNLGLTVGSDIDYVLIKTLNPYTHLPINVILAKSLVHKYFKAEGGNEESPGIKQTQKQLPWKLLATCKGDRLEGIRYEQLLPYEANHPSNAGGDPFRVICGDFVTTEDGTGIVHTAPAFGADDFKMGKKYGLGILVMVDREGKFVDGLGEFSGRYVKNYKDDPAYVDVNVDICVKLKKENRAFKVEKYEHSYPHCWRTDKPVIYYPLDAWFIKTTAVKDRMVELNKTINWKPSTTGTGRFGNWLENMVDWNLSRSRFWGTPLPVWRTSDGSEEICIGSIAELNREIKKANEILGRGVNQNYLHEGILDLHKPYVDEIILVSSTGTPMRREPDLIDVWFDSGAMPYGQWHFPFENKEAIVSSTAQANKAEGFNGGGYAFPADFIAEGVDQTRGWFYTLHALGVMLFDSVAYKAVVSNGLVLDKNGLKMSKRLGNVVDPFEIISSFGADATRWYLITNASPWDNLKFDKEGIKEIQRKFFGTLYNTYQFFALYANVDGFAFKEAPIPVDQRPEIDRWILSALHTLIQKVSAHFDEYEPTLAGRLIEDFLDKQLSNWYVRLCRRRFWKGEYEADKICAYQTLYECLETISLMIAPVSPFFADWLFGNLNEVTHRHQVESVHHARFPITDLERINPTLEERMQMAQDASSLILSLRKKVNIKVRQPLRKVLIPVFTQQMRTQLMRIEDLVKAEVNVKEIEYISNADGFVSKKIKPDFQALGKKLGPRMKLVASALSVFTQQDIATLERDGSFTLFIEGDPISISLNEVEITSEDIPGWMVANKDGLTVALDVTITPDLENEGNARELVNRIQKIRKDSGYELTDRILVKVMQHEALNTSITQYNDYICAEILADKLELVPEIANGTQVEVNDIPLKITVTKKG